jgi:rRNA maturation RNase YbeY
MINFNYETDYQLVSEKSYSNWISKIVGTEYGEVAQLDYIFCDDAYLREINMKYLKHDTYTDIITFDYTDGKKISGDVFISIDRVKENAKIFNVPFETELRRVMAHGILHLLGYGDKSEDEAVIMRTKEEEKMELFHVEQ